MLCLINKNEFCDVYNIMESSFPEDEHRPYDEQIGLLDNNYYKLYGNKNEYGKINAFIALWEFEDFAFIEHFAVSENLRNCGLGSEILAEIKRGSDKILCLEVEIPQTSITRRRVSFYERNGFYLNLYPYIQPPISKGKNPVPLMIMTSGREINESEFNNIRSILYRSVYKVDIV